MSDFQVRARGSRPRSYQVIIRSNGSQGGVEVVFYVPVAGWDYISKGRDEPIVIPGVRRKDDDTIFIDVHNFSKSEVNAIAMIIHFEACMPHPNVTSAEMCDIHSVCCKMAWIRTYREMLRYYTSGAPAVFVHTGPVPNPKR